MRQSAGSREVTALRTVWNDAIHNAFTDLCRFRKRFYLTFRSCPDDHMVFPSSRIRVLVSDDGMDREQVFEFGVPLRDIRDPPPDSCSAMKPTPSCPTTRAMRPPTGPTCPHLHLAELALK